MFERGFVFLAFEGKNKLKQRLLFGWKSEEPQLLAVTEGIFYGRPWRCTSLEIAGVVVLFGLGDDQGILVLLKMILYFSLS